MVLNNARAVRNEDFPTRPGQSSVRTFSGYFPLLKTSTSSREFTPTIGYRGRRINPPSPPPPPTHTLQGIQGCERFGVGQKIVLLALLRLLPGNVPYRFLHSPLFQFYFSQSNFMYYKATCELVNRSISTEGCCGVL